MMDIRYTIELPTSVYAAVEMDGRVFVGGSDWDRRRVSYSKEIAEHSWGVVTIIERNNGTFHQTDTLRLPSMVYSLVRLGGERIFVGCKGKTDNLAVVDHNGSVIKHATDSGGWIYNALLYE